VTLQLSVITCSHNPRLDYLDLVTQALAEQTLDKNCWEYLLIDNGSTEPLSQRADLSWHPHGRHVREEKLGLTNARLRGIQESSGELLVFVDDDNVLDADYLEQVKHIYADWPRIGAFGGQVRPRFEETPPAWTKPYWSKLAVKAFDKDRWSNIPGCSDTTPQGTGLCVHRKVANEYVGYHTTGKRKLMLGRTGESLLSGEDIDLAATACDLGLGNGLFPALKLEHLIPPERLEEDYLARLLEAEAFTIEVLFSLRSDWAPRPHSLRTIMADQVRLLFLDRRRRRFFRARKVGREKATRFLSGNIAIDRKGEPSITQALDRRG